MTRKVRVGVSGYGVIGKRVADAVVLQDDMELVGVADVLHDYRIRVAVERGYPVFAADPARRPGYSFVAQVNYAGAVGRDSARVVSCNTMALSRVWAHCTPAAG